MIADLDEACNVLPSAASLLSLGLDPVIAESVETCRHRSAVQKRVLEREMEVWQIVEEQRTTEVSAERRSQPSGVDSKHRREAVSLGEPKRLQRGSVGSDRGG